MGGCACAAKVSLPEHEPPEVIRDGAITSEHLFHHSRLSIHEAYVVHREVLGQGAFGAVHRATHRATGKVRAVKVLSKKSGRHVNQCKKEVDVMKSLDHPNIVRLVETFDCEKEVHLVLQLCEGGELLTRLLKNRRFTEQKASCVVQQILRGSAYLHSHHIVHRDLKPENCMFLYNAPVRDNVLKIIDFGLACRCGDGELLTSKAGTSHYVAPEVLVGKGYNKQCDLWSTGVITYLLLCGYPPFMAASDQSVLDNVRRGIFGFNPKHWESVSKDAQSFITKLMCMNPQRRPTAEKALGDKWVARKAASQQPQRLCSLPDGSVENMRRYASKDTLSKAVNHVIARSLDDAQVCDLRCAFEAMDVDGDGQLSFSELREGLSGLGLPEDQLMEILEGMGASGNGRVEYTEFLAATLDESQCADAWVCRHAFEVFDWDGDGQISPQDLVSVLQKGEMSKALRAECRAMVEAFDADGDGSISFAEFTSILRR